MMVKTDKKTILYGIFIFFISFSYLTIWIWQGIDLTDSGYNLTKQWLVFNGNIENQLDLMFGSTFIGGLWNSIISGNYLIWAFLGSVLIGSLSVLLIYTILSNYFEKKKAFIAVVSIIPIAVVQIIKVPNYNDIPLLLFLLVIYFLIKAPLVNNKLSKFFLISAGIIYAILVISRFMLIVFLFFPLLLTIYNIFSKQNKIHWFKNSLLFLGGFVVGLTIIFLLLFKYGLLENYFANLYNFFLKRASIQADSINSETDVHSFKNILLTTIKYYYYVLIFTPITIIFLNIFSYLLIIKKDIIKDILVILFSILIILFALYYYVVRIYFIIFGLNIFLILLYLYKSKNKKTNFLLLISLYSQMIINIGSGIQNWTCMYLSSALSIVLLFKLGDFESSSYFKKVINFINLKKILLIILIVLGVITNYFNIYRDSSNRFELVHSFETDNLKCVFTTKDRADAIDEVIEKIKASVNKYDEVLLINSVPLLYYLTETRPVTKDPWPLLNIYSTDDFKNEMEEIFSKSPPEIVVVAKGSPRTDKEWPKNVDTIGVKSRYLEKLDYLYITIDKYNYELEWENKGFELYKKTGFQ